MALYRPIYILYVLVLLVLGWEGFSFYRNFYQVYETTVHTSVTRNLALSQVVNAEVMSQLAEREVSLMFFGDIMLSRSVGKKIVEVGDFTYPFLLVASTTREADILFANLENPISARGKNQGSIYSFRADPEVMKGVVYAGFDIVSVANNHMWDWGRDALEDTLTVLKQNGIESVGAGKNEIEANKPVILNRHGTSFGFLAYTNLMPESLNAKGDNPGFSYFEKEKARSDIQKLKQSVDVVIVSIHWGEEYKTESNDLQKSLARSFIDAGSDLVIGHHPHVVQEVEHYKNGWIAYSLGNFVFDQSFSEATRYGLGLSVKIKGKEVAGVEEKKVNISSDFQPAFVSTTSVR